MYDFYFGTKEEISENEEKYLLFIKRMLPRWCNSIPDSEYLALFHAANLIKEKKENPVLVETGTGASTIILLYFAMKYDGCLYSWDINGLKGAFLRSVITDTLVPYFGKNICDHWKFVPFNSLSPYLGVGILGEMKATVDLCFIDSEHTQEVLLGEIGEINKFLNDGAVVTIDDGNYNYVHTNVSFINMQRKKLGLSSIANPQNNSCQPFYVEVEKYLKSNWSSVVYLDDSYKEAYKKDIFWAYFKTDREVMGKEGMEKLDVLEHRFDSWKVSGRIA